MALKRLRSAVSIDSWRDVIHLQDRRKKLEQEHDAIRDLQARVTALHRCVDTMEQLKASGSSVDEAALQKYRDDLKLDMAKLDEAKCVDAELQEVLEAFRVLNKVVLKNVDSTIAAYTKHLETVLPHKQQWDERVPLVSILYKHSPAAYSTYMALPDMDIKAAFVEAMESRLRGPEDFCLFKKLLADTMHIGKSAFINALTDSLTRMCAALQQKQRKAIFVTLAEGEDCFAKSTFFFLLLAFYLKPELVDLYAGLWCSKGRSTHMLDGPSELGDDVEFVVIDDGIFSGRQLTTQILHVLSWREKPVSVCVAYCKDSTLTRIQDSKTTIYAGVVGASIDCQMYNKECSANTFAFLQDLELSTPKADACTLSPVYFDHKVPDAVSSFPNLYMPLTQDVSTWTARQIEVGDGQHKPYPLKPEVFHDLLDYINKYEALYKNFIDYTSHQRRMNVEKQLRQRLLAGEDVDYEYSALYDGSGKIDALW